MKHPFLLFTFVFAFVLVAPLSTHAQQQILYLNDGQIYTGQISITSDQVGILLSDGHTLTFQSDAVKKITPPDESRHFGLMSYSSLGVWAGTGERDKNTIVSYQATLEYRLFTYVSVGVMTGLEGINELSIPLDATIRLMLPLAQSELFLQGIGGYSYSLGKPDKTEYYEILGAYGGWNACTMIGYSVRLNPINSFFMSVGYRYNEMNYKRTDWYLTTVDRKIIYNRFFVSVGIAFH